MYSEIHNELLVFGHPFVRQDRNKHNIWDDLHLELQNNLLTDQFVDLLKAINIQKGSTHLETIIKICNEAKEKAQSLKLSAKDRKYISSFFEEYLLWTKCF